MTLAELRTPCLLLDAGRMERNIARLKDRLRGLGVPLRPHLKTAKSLEIARLLIARGAEIDPFERCLGTAREGAEPGTLLWSIGQDACECAIVLAPEQGRTYDMG